MLRDYFAWYRRDFHPSQIDDRPLIEEAALELRQAGFITA
jgi:predicted metal-dependent hydrolase